MKNLWVRELKRLPQKSHNWPSSLTEERAHTVETICEKTGLLINLGVGSLET